jgi:capsular exopolysaccharide synthesis family protein
MEYDDAMSVMTEVFEAPSSEVWSEHAIADQAAPLPPVPLPAPLLAALTQPAETNDAVFPTELISVISANPSSRLVYFTEPDGLAAEKFRFLGVRLRQLQQKRALKKVLVTSTIPQEGKSLVAANLACTLARRGQHKVLLLDGDLRRPSLGKLFGLGAIPGISEWLQRQGEPTRCIYQLEGTRLWILPAGNSPQNALELMQSGKLAGLMQKLTAWFDWIVIDSPPVLPLGDTSIWMRVADGALLIARQGVTEKKLLKKGLEALDPSKLLGTVLNGSTKTAHSDYYYQAVKP